MALSLNALAYPEKNDLNRSDKFINLIEITLVDLTIVRLAQNNADVVWVTGGDTWSAIQCNFEIIGDSAKGETPSLTMILDNRSRGLTTYFEQTNGAVGGTVKIYVVSSARLTEAIPETEIQFEITSARINAISAILELSSDNIFRRRFPRNRVLKNACRWKYESIECGYVKTNLRDDTIVRDPIVRITHIYEWTTSGGANEYYVRLTTTAKDPVLIKPDELWIAGTAAAEGVVGSLDTIGVDKWGYGDNDSLGFDTIYVSLDDDADPNLENDAYIQHRMILCDKTIPNCRQRKNTLRFGAFPTIGQRGFVV